MDVPGPNEEEMEWELDPDDPLMAPLDPNDRLANARRPNWEEPAPMRARPKRRQASAKEVRRLQFETARRIIFGERLIDMPPPDPEHPNVIKVPRENWTTAGITRTFDIQFKTPFQLGSVTLMITRGKFAAYRQYDMRGRPTSVIPAPVNAVWMEMPGVIVGRDKRGRPGPHTAATQKNLDGLLINYQWVCIGYLRADDFIPVLPNFCELLFLEVETETAYQEADDQDRSYKWHPSSAEAVTVEGRILGSTIRVEQRTLNLAELSEGGSESKSEMEEGDDDDEEADNRHQFVYSWGADWQQLVPRQNPQPPDAPTQERITDTVLYFDGVEDEGESDNNLEDLVDAQHETEGDFGTYTVEVRPSFGYMNATAVIQYQPLLPIDQARPIFDVIVPEEFLAKLGSPLVGTCTFHRKTQQHGTIVNSFCAWKHEDVAAVIYAQSWLMHVLTGPDRRRYEGMSDIQDAKETREPEPCLRMARSENMNGLFRVELLGEGHIPFVSAGTALRFFTPSLAMRAARVLQQEDASEAQLYGPSVFAHRLSTNDVEELLLRGRQMQKPLSRFQEFEFMGCLVCQDKPATMKATKVPGLRVCSQICYQTFKNKVK